MEKFRNFKNTDRILSLGLENYAEYAGGRSKLTQSRFKKVEKYHEL